MIRPHRGDPRVLCLWCALAVIVEVALYASYEHHDARFHWFTHLFVGASTALVAMAAVAWRTRRPAALPLIWPVLGHLFAMTPDFLFTAGVAHRRWMDLFLGHISTHFVPGRNLTWYLVFAAVLGIYLTVVARGTEGHSAPPATALGSSHIDGPALHPRPTAEPDDGAERSVARDQ